MQVSDVVAGIKKLLEEAGHPEWIAEVGRELMKLGKKDNITIVESAVPLDAEETEKIKRIVGEAEFKINEKLLGGIKVTRGDRLIDLSVRKKLEDIYAA